MDDAAVVSGLHPAGDLHHQLRGGPRGQLADVAGPLNEAPALEELHRHERAPVRLAAVEHLNDVRVPDRGHRGRLRDEPREVAGIGVSAGEDHLQRDEPVEFDLSGLVDDAHSAAPEFTDNVVPRNRDGPSRERHDRRGAGEVDGGLRKCFVLLRLRQRGRGFRAGCGGGIARRRGARGRDAGFVVPGDRDGVSERFNVSVSHARC